MRTLTFWCPGIPQPKGSTSSFIAPSGRVVTLSGRKMKGRRRDGKPRRDGQALLRAWSWAVTVEATLQRAKDGGEACFPKIRDGARVRCVFFLPRPKSHFRRPGVLRADAPVRPTSKPDGDKLERACWDSISGLLLTDDAVIVEWSGAKRWATPPPAGSGPGVMVTVSDIE